MRQFALLLLTTACLSCYAEGLPPPESAKSRNDKIAGVVTKHAETLGCSVSFDPNNIVLYRLNQQVVYLALYSADIGCSGGMGMNRPVIAVLKEGAYGMYFVDLNYSSPAQTSSSFPQVVTEIFIANGELWYKARQYEFKKDPRCCPSLKEIGRVRFENGVWSPIPVKAGHP
ncbi:hypothetical protein E6C76_03365 [Pseudothauera nasutitermitis]|uniref:Uncharacterized protein n=1 Tax=Pseudothauera nasutitermitis TaxID=2565930 RepID=A0A4S4B3Z7_9RHOO|nr:hypothetical protein [Pseudothauera nasutitermitis]THF67417.1 hypothetical protein E6C76_03365 [Pseudothauera nasutitermitis]